jgi:hypothetical protein
MKILLRIFPYLAIFVILLLIVLSPIMLETFGKMLPLDVEYLSKIGGSYGAISAILSGISLCFLAGSSVLQVRQTQITQLHAIRTMQLELLRMSMDNPTYRSALGEGYQAKSKEKWRLHAYLNLWTMHFQMAFLTGSIGEAGLRSWLRNELFDSEHGRQFWGDARSAYRAEQTTQKHKRFFIILEDEFQRKNALLNTRESKNFQRKSGFRGSIFGE